MAISRRTKPRPNRLKGGDLEELRTDCFLRDEGKCKECGCDTWMGVPHEDPKSFHMAHIRGKRMHGDFLWNVRTLCGSCHRKEHQFGKSMQKPVPPKAGFDMCSECYGTYAHHESCSRIGINPKPMVMRNLRRNK